MLKKMHVICQPPPREWIKFCQPTINFMMTLKQICWWVILECIWVTSALIILWFMLPLNEDDINLKMKYLSKTWQVLFKCSWIEKLMLMNILNEDDIKNWNWLYLLPNLKPRRRKQTKNQEEDLQWTLIVWNLGTERCEKIWTCKPSSWTIITIMWTFCDFRNW